MSRARIAVASLGALGLLTLAAPPARPADPGKPGDAYRRIVAIVKEAKSWEPILPHLSYEYRRSVERRDAEGQKALLASFQKSLDHKELVIKRERVVRGDAEIDVIATDAEGRSIQGTIDFELERGGWRLDELSWSPIE